MASYEILIADDHPLFRSALHQALTLGLGPAEALSEEAKAASAGLASLTPQQFRVLTMVCEGLLNKQIAYDLNVSEATVKAHVTAIFRKLNVRTRTQAALLLQQMETVPASH